LGQLSTYERNRQLVEIGAHRVGSNPELDRAVTTLPALRKYLIQDADEQVSCQQAWADLERMATQLGGMSRGWPS